MQAGKFEKELHVKQAIIYEDIDDFMDENPMDSDHLEAKEIEARISRLGEFPPQREFVGNAFSLESLAQSLTEEMRTDYRSKHAELRAVIGDEYEDNYSKLYQHQLACIKDYIKLGKLRCDSLLKKLHWTYSAFIRKVYIDSCILIYPRIQNTISTVVAVWIILF